MPYRVSPVALLVPILCLSTAYGADWEPAPTLPAGTNPRMYAAGVNHQGTLYAIGGTPWQNGGDMDGSVHRLLPGAGSWTATAPLGGLGPVIGQGAGVDSLGRIVVFGGYVDGDGGPGADVVYDPVEGPSGGLAGRPAPESAVGLFAWATDEQRRLYGLGGGPGVGGPNSGYCDRYDAVADTWQAIAPMPTPAADACAVYDGAGHILVLGGINAAGNARLANVARYDIAANTWSDTAVPDMPAALSGARAAMGIDGRVYVAGGESGPIGAGVTQSSVYKLELSDNTWSAAASMATPRKRFAFMLGNDDYLYAVGGENDAGGTNLAEKLFTPRCPAFTAEPQDLTAWSGTIAGFAVATSGATPITYQWRRGGVNLADGPTGTGSTISGAGTSSLTISNPGSADAGSYDCVADNACGTTTSASAVLTVRLTPSLPTQWVTTNLHPAWAQSSSYAFGVSEGRVGGEAYTPTLLPDGRTLTLAHPALWFGPSWTPADLTPGGSVGGGIRDVSGDILAGWFWHTYPCYGGGQWWTCAWQSAAYWTGDPPAFTEAPHGSGPEYDVANGTDGQQVVGTLTYEYTEFNYTSYAYIWTPPNYGVSLHPGTAASNSFANAVDGGRQYGGIHTPYPGPVAHAAMWSGSGASFVDLHPAGFSRSFVQGAGDGQAVGTAHVGDASHAMMWVGSAASRVDLTPAGQTASAADAAGGLQVGTIGSRATIWAGSATARSDLGAFVPAEFSSSIAEGLDIAADGTITVVGYGYNGSTGRYEALMWRSVPASALGDMNCDTFVDQADVAPFTQALIDPLAYGSSFPLCDIANGDMNGDLQVDGLDIPLLIYEVLP